MRLTPVGDVQIQDESQPNETVLDPSIAREYLHAASKELGNPRINVARYESSQGLIATYQAASGKRIVFAANLGPEGKIRAQALHVNPTTGKVEGIINRSKDVGDDGKPLRDVTIDGVNMRAFIKNSVQKTNGHAEKESRLKHFLADDTGDAFLEGLPALYAALEGMESEAELASLAAPFGAVAMVLQLGTKEFRGFKHVDKVLGANKAQAMRNACDPADDCVARGKHFVIHRSGLFDVLGKQKIELLVKSHPALSQWRFR